MGAVVGSGAASGAIAAADAVTPPAGNGGIAVMGAVVGSGAANGAIAVAPATANDVVAAAGGVTLAAVAGTSVVDGAAASGLGSAFFLARSAFFLARAAFFLARATARSAANFLFDAVATA
jgi:hypothetical protein